MKNDLSLVAAALLALAMAGCDRESANRAETATRNAGQKIAAAAEKTGEKISATAERATAGMKESIADNSRVGTSVSGTDGTGVSVSTGERTSLTGISPETRATLGDTAITASIKADYLKDPDLSVLRIGVDTTDGVVTLNGTAESDAARKRAEQLAGAQKGVKQVRNYLTLKRD